jgi:hypothetical protein
MDFMNKKLLSAGFMILFTVAAFAQSTIQDPFFEKVKYRGAFGSTDWTKTWANFDPQNTVYPSANITVEGEINSSTTWSSNKAYIYGKQSFTASALANNSAIDKTPTYVGAFGATDWTKGWSNYDPQNTPYFAVTDTIKTNASGEITTDLTLTRGKTYLLVGYTYVTAGHTLTIQSGVIIRGDKTTKGTLIVEPGAKLIANGTAVDPIIFTSNQAQGSRSYGDWGGVVLCGKGQTNQTDPVIEGGPRTHYGGTDDADNSGSLKYVRIEFPGIAFMPDKEINGLTLAAVGSGTTIDYVQVSYSGDDSYEWFGGAVNCKHLIALRGWDDDFDTDFGYRGTVQFAVAVRDPQIADPQSGSNGFESDNDAAGDYNKPYTNAIFSNVSLFGPYATPSTSASSNFKRAMHIRRNSRLQVYNSIFAGWGTGIVFEGNAVKQTSTDSIQFKNNIMAGMKTDFAVTAGQWTNETAGEAAWFLAHNDTLASVNELQISNPFNLTAPVFTPAKTAYLLKGFVYVTDGATLTIEPGTVIRGDKASKGSLIVERGGKLIANGTVDQPIVFTSNQEPNFRSYGDWGGVILCGKAIVNQTDPVIEGGPRSHYGGTNNADNSGSLQYVRIEFPGIAFMPDKEINGLTFGGVGSGTTIENIQVSYSGDDSYEWFGGAVNCKHIIALRGWDDDFDTDFGYQGKIQFAVALRDPSVADPQSGSNGFESDNDAAGDYNKPYTNAVFSNFSDFGPYATPSSSVNSNFKSAMHIRRNSRLQVYNSVFAGWGKGLLFEGKAVAQTGTDSINLKFNTLAGIKTDFAVTAGQWTNEAAGEAAWFLANNDTLATVDALKVKDAFNLTSPNFLLDKESPVANNSIWTVAKVTISGTATINTDGGSTQLTATVEPSNALDPSLSWSIVPGSVVASIDQTGKVTASSADNGNGTIKVVAISNDGTAVSDTFEVVISSQKGDAVNVSSIVISGTNGVSYINYGENDNTLQLSATILPTNATVQTVTWSIAEGENIASINQSGLLTATGNGVVKVKAEATDGSKVAATFSVTVSGFTALKINTESNITLYPNPVVNTLNISNAENISRIVICNMMGQVVRNLNNTENLVSINLSDLKSGIYIIKLMNEDGTSSVQKFIKK